MEESQEHFEPEHLLISNFILLSYTYDGLIGTSLDKKTLFIYEKKKDQLLSYQLKYQYIFPLEIYNVFLFDVSNKSKGYFVNFYRDGKFLNKILVESELIHLETTRAAPFLILNENLISSLVMQNEKNTYILSVNLARDFVDEFKPGRIFFDNKVFLETENSEDVSFSSYKVEIDKLLPEHTSAYFIDENSNPILVLQTVKDGRNYLSLYTKIGKDFKFLEEHSMPSKTGPLLFGDFYKTGNTSVAFLSKENFNYYLNVLENRGNKQFFDVNNENNRKINLNPYFKDGTPNLKKNGSKVIDVFNDSLHHIVISIETVKGSKLVLLKNNGNCNFIVETNLFAGINITHLTSFSFNDLDSSGKEGLILNYFEDGKQKLVYRKNNLPIDFYFSVISYDKTGNHPLPGISYRYDRMEDNEFRLANQLMQTSFPHLMHPQVFFGLGGAPFLIELSKVIIPDFDSSGMKSFKIYQKIIPNSNLLLKISKSGIKMALILNAGTKIKSIFLFFIIVLLLNLALLTFVHFLEKRIKKREETKNVNYVSALKL